MRQFLFPLIIQLMLTVSTAEECLPYSKLIELLTERKITIREVQALYDRCYNSKNGYQPTCDHAPPETQAIAKVDNKGQITTASGDTVEFRIQGVVSFQQLSSEKMRVYAVFTGVKAFLSDSDRFLLHVHQKGDINPSCTFTGGHFNPCEKEHSDDPKSKNRHIGDVAKVTIDPDSNRIVIDTIDTQVKLSGPLSVLGRSVTIHAGAGAARVGCGIIAVSQWSEGEIHPDALKF